MNIFITVIILILLPLSGYSQIKSQTWEYYLSKGKIQYASQMHEYAIYNLQTALQLNPRLYEAANILAEIYLKKNQKRKALELFTSSQKINTKQPDICSKIGEMNEYFGNTATSFEYYKKALDINPKHIRANLFIARYYLKHNKSKLAHKHFLRSYTEGDKISLPYFAKANDAENKAETYLQGKYQEAVKYYTSMEVISEQKIKQFNTYIEEHKRDFNYAAIERLRYKLGVIYFKRALRYYQMTIEASPAKVEAYIRSSLIFRKCNRFLEAIEILNKLAEVKPDNEMAHSMLGHLYYTRKIPGKRNLYLNLAMKHLEKALVINPGNGENMLLLAHLYYQTGRVIKARTLEKKAELIDKINK